MSLQTRLSDLITAIGADIKDIRAKAIIPVVAALPGSPADGDRIFFQSATMAAAGVMWQLRYRSTKAGGGANPNTYKWEFVGGVAMANETNVHTDTTSTAYVDLASSLPSIVVPLAGNYDVEFGANLASNAPGTYMYVAPKIGAAATDDANAMIYAAGWAGSNARMIRFSAIAALTTLKLQCRVNGGTGGAEKLWLRVLPVSVG